MKTPQIRSLLQIEEERDARIKALADFWIDSAKDPLEALTKRVEVLEATLEKLTRKVEPESHDHEWGEVRQRADRCTCVTWIRWQDQKPGRKYNRFCRVHSS